MGKGGKVMIIEGLLLLIIVLLLVLIFLSIKGRKEVEDKNIESAISNTWTKLGLGEKIGEIGLQADEIKRSYKSVEQMLRVPKERASFGELTLEAILTDQLPPDMYGIREEALDGKHPDAHIKSTIGTICIDSKFPLDNYRSMVLAENSQEKEGYKKLFIRDVRKQLDEIAKDYICPDKGSADFAFGFIPSEAVYYFLISEAFDMLRDYSRKNVQVVSPLILSNRVELIKAGVRAKKLSEDPEKQNVTYKVDWGDGQEKDWFGPFESGETAKATHTWEKGTYTIQAWARDKYGKVSDPGTLKVEMPKSKAFNINPLFLRFLEQHANLFPVFRYLLGL